MGKRAKLRFDFEAIIRLEEECNIHLLKGLDADVLSSANTYLSMYWAGQLYTNPELTIEEARAQLSNYKANQVIEMVTEAVKEALGEDEPAVAADSGSSQ